MADTPDYILSEHRRELTAEDYEWLRINCRKDSSLEATQRYAALLESHRELNAIRAVIEKHRPYVDEPYLVPGGVKEVLKELFRDIERLLDKE